MGGPFTASTSSTFSIEAEPHKAIVHGPMPKPTDGHQGEHLIGLGALRQAGFLIVSQAYKS